MWLLDPPNPNELTDIRRKPVEGHGMDEVGTYNGQKTSKANRDNHGATYLQHKCLSIDLRIPSFK
jgi:hypothetical protein